MSKKKKINKNRNTKQMLIVRKDLKMRKGKIGAQCAHASLSSYITHYPRNSDMFDLWLSTGSTKICVSIDSEDELIEIYNLAKANGIPATLIIDAGHTEFKGVPTKTVVALGPDYDENINKLTSNLKLL